MSSSVVAWPAAEDGGIEGDHIRHSVRLGLHLGLHLSTTPSLGPSHPDLYILARRRMTETTAGPYL